MRYRTSDLPPKGVGAFMPIPAVGPVASSYGLVEVDGAPGTEPTPAPAPQRNFLPSLTARGGKNSAQSSEVVPDVMLFSVYVAHADHMGPEAGGLGMTRRRHNELPVPSVDPMRLPVVAMQPAQLGGRTAMAWPRSFQRFPQR